MRQGPGLARRFPTTPLRPLRRVPMVVQVQRVRHGRLRARFRSGEWQFSDRVSWHICDHGKRPDHPPRPAGGKVPQ